MKILFVVEYYAPHIGGVETFFQHLAEGLASRGVDVMVLTSSLPGAPHDERLNTVRIHRIRLPRVGTRYWFTLLTPFVLWRLISHFDLVHTTTYNAAFPAWLCARLWRKKVIITVHEVWGKLWFRAIRMNRVSAFLHWLYESFVMHLHFDTYVGVSDFTRKAIEKIHGNRKNIVRIYHGIDYTLFDPLHYDRSAFRSRLNLGSAFTYLYYGRTGWAKGIELLVRAVPGISHAVPGSRCLMVLSRDPQQLFDAIIANVSKLGIQHNVTILDPLPRRELPALLCAVDCVIVPSLAEGFGFTAAESCAMRRPVAVSRAGSLPEVVSGQVRFFEPGNVQDLIRSVSDIAQGKSDELPTKRFKWSEAIDQYLMLYRHLLEGR